MSLRKVAFFFQLLLVGLCNNFRSGECASKQTNNMEMNWSERTKLNTRLPRVCWRLAAWFWAWSRLATCNWFGFFQCAQLISSHSQPLCLMHSLYKKQIVAKQSHTTRNKSELEMRPDSFPIRPAENWVSNVNVERKTMQFGVTITRRVRTRILHQIQRGPNFLTRAAFMLTLPSDSSVGLRNH